MARSSWARLQANQLHVIVPDISVSTCSRRQRKDTDSFESEWSCEALEVMATIASYLFASDPFKFVQRLWSGQGDDPVWRDRGYRT